MRFFYRLGASAARRRYVVGAAWAVLLLALPLPVALVPTGPASDEIWKQRLSPSPRAGA